MDILYELDKQGLLNDRIKKLYFSFQTDAEKKSFCSNLFEKKKLLNKYNSKSKKSKLIITLNVDETLKNLDLYPVSYFLKILSEISEKENYQKVRPVTKKQKKIKKLKKRKTLSAKEIKLIMKKNKYEKFASIKIPDNPRIFANYSSISTRMYS